VLQLTSSVVHRGVELRSASRLDGATPQLNHRHVVHDLTSEARYLPELTISHSNVYVFRWFDTFVINCKCSQESSPIE
jgi:hypothetical protein